MSKSREQGYILLLKKSLSDCPKTEGEIEELGVQGVPPYLLAVPFSQ